MLPLIVPELPLPIQERPPQKSKSGRHFIPPLLICKIRNPQVSTPSGNRHHPGQKNTHAVHHPRQHTSHTRLCRSAPPQPRSEYRLLLGERCHRAPASAALQQTSPDQKQSELFARFPPASKQDDDTSIPKLCVHSLPITKSPHCSWR